MKTLKKLRMISWVAIILLGLFLFSGCTTYTSSWRSTELGRQMSSQGGQAVVSLTYAEVREGRRKEFMGDVRGVLKELPDQEGLLGYSFRFQLFGRKAWTMTAWRDEADLRRFIRSNAHRAAASQSDETTQAMRFHTVPFPAQELPMKWAEGVDLVARMGIGYSSKGSPSLLRSCPNCFCQESGTGNPKESIRSNCFSPVFR